MKKIIAFLLLLHFQAPAQQVKRVIDTAPIKVDSLLWDLKTLSNAPDFHWLNDSDPVRALLYKSVDYEGKPTEVFAYYSNPDLIAGKTASGRKFPGMVLIHGGGGKAFKEWVEKWAKEGYAAIAMDLSGNGADGKKIQFPGPEQSNENKFQKIEKGDIRDVWTYHAVASSILAHSLLLSFPEIDPDKTGVTGISWGGYLTCIVGSLDNRFVAAAPVYGCAFYDESDVFKVPLNELTPAGKARWMHYFDPSTYMPYAKRPFFFINGNKDKHYNVDPYIKTYELIKDRQVCLIPDMKHSHQWGWQPPEIRTFFDGVMNGNNKPLLSTKSISRKKDELKLVYIPNASNQVSVAEFYYSNDTTSTNEERVWIRKEATLDQKKKTVTCIVPGEGFKYGFFYLQDGNGVSGTTWFLRGI